MRLKQITDTERNPETFNVDILAIHGSFEGEIDTWTEPSTGVFWLGNLLQAQLPEARILTYGYDVGHLGAGDSASEWILSKSLQLVADLHTDRYLCGALKRPLIFICHGLGGIIVKRALAFSNTSKAKQVQHRRSIFTSTFAILFLGTLHEGLHHPESPDTIQLLGESKLGISSDFFVNPEVLQDINDQFAPLTKRFSIYCFWEQVKTSLDDGRHYIVGRESAVPPWADIEQAGMNTDHSHLCKFSTSGDPGFKLILAALKRYARLAPEVIGDRWREDRKLLQREIEQEAAELLRVDSGLSEEHKATLPVRNEHFSVPRIASSIFTGRAEVAQKVRQKFFTTNRRNDDNQHKIFVLYGLGGSGKSQFCLKFAQDNRDQYWGVFWIDASTEQNAETSYARLGSIAHKDATFEAGKYWLCNRDEPWLLIIDNADDPDLDLLRLFPAGGGGHILVTTRNPNNVVHATVGEEPFGEMEPEDAVTLLLKAAHEPGRNDFLDPERRKLAMPIATALGYLALALTHAGATIRRNIYTLEGYLSEYTKHRLLPKNGKSPDLAEETITTTWEMPYRRIEYQKTTTNLDAIDILHVFAFLHFKDIPELLFQKSWERLHQPVGLSKSYVRSFFSVVTGSQARELPHMLRQEGAIWDKPRFHRALAVLSELSLVYYDTEKEYCSMHPVVHAWARERLPINLQRRWRGIVTNMLSASINTMLEASGRRYRRTLLPHIECCLKDPVFELGGNADPDGACVLKFASVYAECGLWKQAQKLQRDVVRLRTRLYGAAHIECLTAMRDLGHTCWNLFDLKEGLEVQTMVFETRTRLHGLTDPLGLKAMDDLARSYWLLGDRKKSRDLGAAAILGLKQCLGPADPATLTAMHNLACTLLHLGQFEKASKLLIEVLEIRTRFWGLQHDDTLATMSELGMCYLKMGRLADAEYYSGKALENRTAILGEEHAYTLWSINDLSKVRCARGHAEEAASMLEDIIPVVERTLGNAHVGMSMTRYNLATAYAEQKRWHEAETILKQQLEVVSPQHPDWGISMKQLAGVYERQGRKEEAQEVLASISPRRGSSGEAKACGVQLTENPTAGNSPP